MTEPEYNPNAVRELNETMRQKPEEEVAHSQQGWKKKQTNIIDKSAGKNALDAIRESMKK